MSRVTIIALVFLLAESAAFAAPAITEILYTENAYGMHRIVVKDGAPFPKVGIKGSLFRVCHSKPLPARALTLYVGTAEATNFHREKTSLTCMIGRFPNEAMTGKIKLVTTAGSYTYPHPFTLDFAPGERRCMMAASVSAKWSDAQRSKLMVTLTFTNTGKYDCWVTPEDAAGKYFVNSALRWWTDGKCQSNFTGGSVYLLPNQPGRAKTLLPVGQSLTTTFDAFSLPNYEKLDCPGTPAPKKVFVMYQGGHNEVFLQSPVFEMPW